MRKKKTFKQWSPGTGITAPIHREMLEKKNLRGMQFIGME